MSTQATTRDFVPLPVPSSTVMMNDSHDQDYMADDLFPPLRNRPAVSTQRLSRMDLQRAIHDVKQFVECRLESDLNLIKHTAPLGFLRGTGVNDELDGTESKKAVSFTVPNVDIPRGIESSKIDHDMEQTEKPYQMECEIVQSLAKWKRIMLQRLDCPVGQGLYCDSTSIRKGYRGDVTHSVVADQWDFEIRLAPEQRTIEHLKTFVNILWKIITDAEDFVLDKYQQILLPGHPTSAWRLPKHITFITAQELHDTYPDLDIHGRETAAVRQHGAIFIVGMGWPMADGSPPEEVRSPGYDDWTMNGDIMVYHPLTEYRHEISSMGIRVDANSLRRQLEHRGVWETEKDLSYQKAVLDNRLPLSYGGGIGISRLLMLLLRTGHIGEVQVGLWHDAHYAQAARAGMDLIPDRLLDLDPKRENGPNEI